MAIDKNSLDRSVEAILADTTINVDMVAGGNSPEGTTTEGRSEALDTLKKIEEGQKEVFHAIEEGHKATKEAHKEYKETVHKVTKSHSKETHKEETTAKRKAAEDSSATKSARKKASKKSEDVANIKEKVKAGDRAGIVDPKEVKDALGIAAGGPIWGAFKEMKEGFSEVADWWVSRHKKTEDEIEKDEKKREKRNKKKDKEKAAAGAYAGGAGGGGSSGGGIADLAGGYMMGKGGKIAGGARAAGRFLLTKGPLAVATTAAAYGVYQAYQAITTGSSDVSKELDKLSKKLTGSDIPDLLQSFADWVTHLLGGKTDTEKSVAAQNQRMESHGKSTMSAADQALYSNANVQAVAGADFVKGDISAWRSHKKKYDRTGMSDAAGTYAEHMLGAGGASKLFSALQSGKQSSKIEDVLDADQITANSSLRGMTAGTLAQSFEQYMKIGGKRWKKEKDSGSEAAMATKYGSYIAGAPEDIVGSIFGWESGFDKNSKASTSSASGYGQLIDDNKIAELNKIRTSTDAKYVKMRQDLGITALGVADTTAPIKSTETKKEESKKGNVTKDRSKEASKQQHSMIPTNFSNTLASAISYGVVSGVSV